MDDQAIFSFAITTTTVITIPVKLFTIYIISTKTPKDHRHESHFILNVMIWNLLINLVFAGVHLYPMYPAECFLVYGPIGDFIHFQYFGHVVYIFVFVCCVNTGLALSFAFPYRFVLFAYPQLAERIRPLWVYSAVAITHIAAATLQCFVMSLWAVSIEDSRERAEIPQLEQLYCWQPDGWRHSLYHTFFALSILIPTSTILTFAALLYRRIKRNREIVHPETILLQRRFLWNLVVFTSVIMFFGGIPMFGDVVLSYYPHLPQARNAAIVLFILAANHGTISAISTLLLYKAYRRAVCRIFGKYEKVLLVIEQTMCLCLDSTARDGGMVDHLNKWCMHWALLHMVFPKSSQETPISRRKRGHLGCL